MIERNRMRQRAGMICGCVFAGWMMGLLAGCNEPIDSSKEVSGSSSVSVSSNAGIKVTVNPVGGGYTVSTAEPAWTFSGTLGATLSNLQVEEAIDKIGHFKGIRFQWAQGGREGLVRVYEGHPVVLFEVTYAKGVSKPDVVFPDFTAFPKGLHALSFEKAFAQRTSSLQENGAPWILFNNRGQTFVLSAASNFMIAQMKGNGVSHAGCGLNTELQNIPAGFSHQSLLAVGNGINRTWESWGGALTRKGRDARAAKLADDSLKYLGYWTDEGAAYDYHFEADLGYENTLLEVKKRYTEQGTPFGYIELGDWFYLKGVHNPAGELDLRLRTGGEAREDDAPSWNHSGGMMEYVADTALFPKGTLEFRRFMGGRMMTHCGWIDLKSPYRDSYEVSGIAPVDEKFWRKGMAKLAMKGVDCLQQDDLDVIYDHSPALRSTVDVGQAYLGNMAAACLDQDVTMHYGRAYPRHFLQGSMYQNLTTIRTSEGRFDRGCYDGHLYASRLGYSLGIWPWGGVCDTHQEPDMLMMVLSAGVVGVGEALGAESVENIKKCIRSDGVVIKSDAPLLPLDRCLVADANRQASPMIAATYNDHVIGKTYYVFAYTRDNEDEGRISFTPMEIGMTGAVYVYDYYAGIGRYVESPEIAYDGLLRKDREGTGYFVVSPLSKDGIAVIGDPDKYVTSGESRIEEVSQYQNKTVVNVTFAKGEQTVKLIGYANHEPAVSASNGAVELSSYDVSSGMFNCTVKVTDKTRRTLRQGQDLARVVVTME